MYDYGEYVSPTALSHDKTRGLELHNAYPVQYQKVAFDFFATKVRTPTHRAPTHPPPDPLLTWRRGAVGWWQDEDPTDPFAPDYLYYVRSGFSGSQSVIWAHWTGALTPLPLGTSHSSQLTAVSVVMVWQATRIAGGTRTAASEHRSSRSSAW